MTVGMFYAVIIYCKLNCSIHYHLQKKLSMNTKKTKTNDKIKYFCNKFSKVKLLDISIYDGNFLTQYKLLLSSQFQRKSKLATDTNKLVFRNVGSTHASWHETSLLYITNLKISSSS